MSRLARLTPNALLAQAGAFLWFLAALLAVEAPGARAFAPSASDAAGFHGGFSHSGALPGQRGLVMAVLDRPADPDHGSGGSDAAAPPAVAGLAEVRSSQAVPAATSSAAMARPLRSFQARAPPERTMPPAA